MISNTTQNRQSFGAIYPRVYSNLVGEMVQGDSIPTKEIPILQKFAAEAKNEWKFLRTEEKHGEKYYHFQKGNGDKFELQPEAKFSYSTPGAKMTTADGKEELLIKTGAQYTTSKETETLFQAMKKAFMGLAPEEPKEKTEHFGHII